MTRTRYRWFIIFLLFAITVVNYIDRAAISYAIPLMQRDLGLSPADTGIILGAFGLGYAITSLIGGFAVDRYGARVVLAVAAILWSLSIGATGFASGFTFLYAARLLLGLSEGPNFPALTGAVSHWLSPHERATALGYALLAVPLALAIGGPSARSFSAGSTGASLSWPCSSCPSPGCRCGISFSATIRRSPASSMPPSSPISGPAIPRSPPHRMPS